MLQSLVSIMQTRKEMSHEKQAEARWILIVIDELRSVVFNAMGKPHTENVALLDLLMREGRELKIRVMAATQYRTGTLGISTFEQFAYRVVMGAPSAQTAMVTFGMKPPIVPSGRGEFTLLDSWGGNWYHGHSFDTPLSLVEGVVNVLPSLVKDGQESTEEDMAAAAADTQDDPSLPLVIRILRLVFSHRRNKGMLAAKEALGLQSKHQAEEAFKLLRSWGILEKTGSGTSGHVITKGMTLQEAEAETMKRLHGDIIAQS